MLFSKKKEEKVEKEEVANEIEVEQKLDENDSVSDQKAKIINSIDGKIKEYSDVDFNKFSKEKMFEIICELIIELKSAKTSLSKYDSENIEFYEKTEKALKNEKDTNKIICYIARKLSSTYNSENVNGTNKKYSSYELAEVIIQDVLQDKSALQKKVVELMENELHSKKLVEELSNQILNANLKATEAAVEDNSPIEINSIENFLKEKRDVPSDKIEPVKTTGESINGHIALVPIDIDKAKEQLGDIEYCIIEAMGSTGMSLAPDILKVCVDKNYTESKARTAIARLEQLKIIKSDLVMTIKIKRGVKVSYLTQEIGKTIYKNTFTQPFVESECKQIEKDHDNLRHGYSIKEISKTLEGLGYTNITYDRKSNSIHIGDNKYWIPDIIATNPITKSVEYFEVEFANHNQENFNDKMTKANLKANVLRFVVPSDLARTKLRNEVNNWIATKKNKTMLVSIATSNELENKNYGIEIK